MARVKDLWFRKDKTPTAKNGKGKRWLAVWQLPDGSEDTQAFTGKAEATAFLNATVAAINAGTYIDPARGKKPVSHWTAEWLATKAGLADSTLDKYNQAATRVLDEWGDKQTRAVDELGIKKWLASLAAEGVSVYGRRDARVALFGILELALEARAIGSNPVRKIPVPELPQKRDRTITVGQVTKYVQSLESTGEHAAVFGLTLVFSGVRFGEASRFDVEHLVREAAEDSAGEEVAVDVLQVRGAIRTRRGRQSETDGKRHRHRDVPLEAPIADRIREFLGDRTEGPLLPAARGGRWNQEAWRRVHRKALADAGLPYVKPHALRHTAVTMAIKNGADVYDVQQKVGHAKASVTLDVYGEQLRGSLARVTSKTAALVPKRLASGPQPEPRHLRSVP